MPQPNVPTPAGTANKLNITAATVVTGAGSTVPGFLVTVNVITAGTTAGGVYDTNATGSAAAATQIDSIPNTVGSYQCLFKFNTGLTVVPGTGQVVAVSYGLIG